MVLSREIMEACVLENQKAVALLDSGVGGLTVVREIFKQLPREKVVYFGDTARMPYGPRSYEEVRGYVYQIIDFLQTQEIKSIIVACNSATAAGMEYYKEKVDLPLLGVIEPGVRAALQETGSGKIGVIGTTGTIESGAYQDVLQRMAPRVELFSQACPLFVLIVENDLVHSPEAERVAEEYLGWLREEGVDTLIMGCTHYPLLEKVVRSTMGPGVRLISSARETAREARSIMENKGLLRVQEDYLHHRFYVSGPAAPFEEMAARLLESKIRAYQVVLGER